MLRILFLLLTIAGILAGIAYPFVVQNFGGYEVARRFVPVANEGFRAVEIELNSVDSPVRVLVDYTSRSQVNAVMASAELEMVVSHDRSVVARERLRFVHSTPGEGSVQSGRYVYRATGGIVELPESGAYVFRFALVGETTLQPESVELIVMASAIEWDPRVQPVGYALMALGFVGFIIAMTQRSKTRPAAKPRPRWGRQDGSEE